jgi:hypothetical protein
VQSDPEVPISGLQLLDEPLDQTLLIVSLDTEELCPIRPAGLPGIIEGHPPPWVLEVVDPVAGSLCATPADPLAYSASHWKTRNCKSRKQIKLQIQLENCKSKRG